MFYVSGTLWTKARNADQVPAQEALWGRGGLGLEREDKQDLNK